MIIVYKEKKYSDWFNQRKPTSGALDTAKPMESRLKVEALFQIAIIIIFYLAKGKYIFGGL